MEEFSRELPDLGGAAVRGNTDVLGESPLLTEEALNTMPSRLSFIKWAKSRGLDVSEVPSDWNDRRFESDSIETAWIGWFNALNTINPVDHNIVALSGSAAVRGEAVTGKDRALKEYSLDEYQPGQWWLTELENHASHRVTSDDTRRAAGIALDFAAKVFSARAADAPSEPSELLVELREAARNANISGNCYADIMRRAADSLDSQPTGLSPADLAVLRDCAVWFDEHEKSMVSGSSFPWNPLQCNDLRWKVQKIIVASSQPTDGGVRNV